MAGSSLHFLVFDGISMSVNMPEPAWPLVQGVSRPVPEGC